MKILVLFLSLLSGIEVYAMRCGADLVYEGDNYFQVIKKCGDPTGISTGGILDDGLTLYYNNRNGDGMNYTIELFKDNVVNIIQERAT